MRCNAKSKRSGAQCKSYAVTGSSKCRMHGGSSLAGAASPSFKTGRYSKYLPERLAGRYLEALGDARLLELRDEIALMGVRLGELVERIDTGESAQRWQALEVAHEHLRQSIQRQDATAMRAALGELATTMRAGQEDYAIWQEVVALTEQRRKLVESEHKRLVSMQQMITSEQAMILLAAITDVVRRNVSDPSTLAAISADIRQLTIIDAG